MAGQENAQPDWGQRLWTGYRALRIACRAQHPGSDGGAARCICGAPCGGSEACQNLEELRDMVLRLPVDTLDSGLAAEVLAFRNAMR